MITEQKKLYRKTKQHKRPQAFIFFLLYLWNKMFPVSITSLFPLNEIDWGLKVSHNKPNVVTFVSTTFPLSTGFPSFCNMKGFLASCRIRVPWSLVETGATRQLRGNDFRNRRVIFRFIVAQSAYKSESLSADRSYSTEHFSHKSNR